MSPFLPLTVLGLMSGTSADGIDAALVVTDGLTRPKLLAAATFAHPPAIRQRVMALYQPDADELDRLGDLDRELGELFAQAALELCARAAMPPHQVDLIGSHGQTVRHRPPRFTWQIANPFVISARTGITTIADFRPADVARHGEGAPLTPAFHHCLFQKSGATTAVVNLGGIANLTALPGDDQNAIVAGDCGPANTLLDLLAATLSRGALPCDRDGQMAATGRVDGHALDWLLQHPYLAKPYPKSTGREDFGQPLLARFLEQFPHLASPDGMATLTQFTAITVAESCRRLLPPWPERLILCGGGARNPELCRRLQAALPHTTFEDSWQHQVDPDSLEAQAFAWFAVRTWRGLPSSLPGATGANSAAILGAIHPGRLWPPG